MDRNPTTSFEPLPDSAASSSGASQIGELLARQVEAVGSSSRRSRSHEEGAKLGKYLLLGKIGEGGLGEVYSALHERSSVKVAIKVLHLPQEATPLLERLDGKRRKSHAQNRLLREIHSAASVRSEHVVAALDANESQGISYLVMEWLDGLDVSQILRRAKVISLADAAEIIRQAALGLADIHRVGFTHRDIKPSNLMVTCDGKLKILDLGLSRGHNLEGSRDLTQAYQFLGTADYTSPEQSLDARTADIRSDIYSLGCTFFKLLTGRAPYATPENETSQQQILAHREDPIPYASDLRPDLPAKVDELLALLLAKKPQDRPQHPLELVTALAPFCQGSNLAALVRNAIDHPLLLPGNEQEPGTISLQEGISSVTETAPAKIKRRSPANLYKPSRREWIAGGVAASLGLSGAFLWSNTTITPSMKAISFGPEHKPDPVYYDKKNNTIHLQSPAPQIIQFDSHAPGAGVIQVAFSSPHTNPAYVPGSVGVILGLRPFFGPILNSRLIQTGIGPQVGGQFISFSIHRPNSPSFDSRKAVVARYSALMYLNSAGVPDMENVSRNSWSEFIPYPKHAPFTLRVEFSSNALTRVSLNGIALPTLTTAGPNQSFTAADYAPPFGIYYSGRSHVIADQPFFGSA